MIAAPAVKPLPVLKQLWIAFGAAMLLAASWLVQTPRFFDAAPDYRLTGVLAGMVVAGSLVSWISVEKALGVPWLRRLTNAAQAGTMVSVSIMAIEAVRGVIDGFRSVDAGAAALVANTPPVADGLFSPRVAAWAVFSFALWLFLLSYHRHRAEADVQARLRREAEDAALRARLAPHFIFNALNTLKAQIELAPSEAAATADRLASLFRQVLALTDRPTIPLREELAFVEAYLGIERARLGPRLRVRFDVAEALEAVEVPSLSLQVLVENAVKHGVAPREEGGEILIWARWSGPGSGRRLLIGVESPAAPPLQRANASKGTGTGLQALRGRLDQPADLVIDSREGRYRAHFSCREVSA